jgi:Kef-type K+ transport system membrane component KefB
MHADPLAHLALNLAVILVGAKLLGDVAQRAKQPAVLGELVFGLILGNLDLLHWHYFEALKHDAMLDMLARLGVLLLLFEVGLESNIRDMVKVGMTSLVVATLGVVTPFFLGWGVGALLLPHESIYVHVFLGATLTATSVGITARVLQDLGKTQTAAARIVLGAAVIDDVMGLVVLAVVTGIIGAADKGTSLSALGISWVLVKAIGFLVGSLFLGMWLSPRLFSLASRLRARGVLLAMGLAACFLMAYLADLVGLAAIVGAFAAGLVLEDVHYKDFTERGEHGLEELIKPLASFLSPVFFVLMGMRIDLRAFANTSVLALAGALTLVAILGKQACSLGVRHGDRLSVGIGMIPRGEVGLVFANIGLSLSLNGRPVVSESTFSGVLLMVIVTTLVTPPALRWSLARYERAHPPPVTTGEADAAAR